MGSAAIFAVAVLLNKICKPDIRIGRSYHFETIRINRKPPYHWATDAELAKDLAGGTILIVVLRIKCELLRLLLLILICILPTQLSNKILQQGYR